MLAPVTITPDQWANQIFDPFLDSLLEVMADNIPVEAKIHLSGPLFELEYVVEYLQNRIAGGADRFLPSTDE